MVLASLIFFEPQKGLALSYQCGIVRLLVVNRLLPKNMGPPFDLTYQSVPRGSGSRGRAGREEGTAGEGGAVFRRVSTFGTRISDEPPTPFRMVPTGGAELTHLNAVSHSGPRRARKPPALRTVERVVQVVGPSSLILAKLSLTKKAKNSGEGLASTCEG